MKKTKILLSSILTIMLCVSLITGATFALFTSESSVNIAITSGKVQVEATIDPNLSGYYYVEGTTDHMDPQNGANTITINGSATATIDGKELEVANFAPGYVVSFGIGVVNHSTVAAKYSVEIAATDKDGVDLFKALKITVADKVTEDELPLNSSTSGNRYSEWKDIAAAENAEVGDEIQTLNVTVEFPFGDNDNALQNKTCNIAFAVRAIQGNAKAEALPSAEAIGIYSVTDLNELASQIEAQNGYEGKTIVLMRDIDFNNPTTAIAFTRLADTTSSFSPIGTAEAPFKGTFDGQGYAIKNLSVVGTRAALFGVTENAAIANVNIVNANVKATEATEGESTAAGVLVGEAKGTLSLSQVTVTDSTATAAEGVEKANIGALVGMTSAAGETPASVTIEQVSVTTTESENEFTSDNTHSDLVGGGNVDITYEGESVLDIELGKDFVNTITYDGSAEKENVYRVLSKTGLISFRKVVNEDEMNFKGETVRLESNINLAGENWEPIGVVDKDYQNGQKLFRGTFDGQDHIISNLTIVTTESGAGLFNSTDAKYKNLTIENVNITGTEYVGSLVGYGYTSDYEKINVKNATLNGNHWMGGIAGGSYSNFTDCHVEGLVITCTPDGEEGHYDNGDKVGGLIGIGESGTFYYTNCSVEHATLTAYRDVGGFVGCANVGHVVTSRLNDVKIIIDRTKYYGDKDVNAGAYIGRCDSAKESDIVDTTSQEAVTDFSVGYGVAGGVLHDVVFSKTYGGFTYISSFTVYDEEDVMFINTALSDDMIAYANNKRGESYKVTVNFVEGQTYDFADIEWIPLHLQAFILEGHGATIKNIKTVEGNEQAGFLSYAGNITVNNLTFENITATGAQVGVVAGQTDNGTYNNVTIKGNVVLNWSDATVKPDGTAGGIGVITGLFLGGNIGEDKNITLDCNATLNLGNMGAYNLTTTPEWADDEFLFGRLHSGYNKPSAETLANVIKGDSYSLTTGIFVGENETIALGDNINTFTLPESYKGAFVIKGAGAETSAIEGKIGIASAHEVIVDDIALRAHTGTADYQYILGIKGNLTMNNSVVNRMDGNATAYGLLINVDGNATLNNSTFVAPVAGDTSRIHQISPSVLEVKGKLIMDGGVISTNGYGLFSQHVVNAEISNVTFCGLEDYASYYNDANVTVNTIYMAMNNTVIEDMTFKGCTIKDCRDWGMLVGGGKLVVEDCDFTGLDDGIVAYTTIADITVKNNTFNLAEGKLPVRFRENTALSTTRYAIEGNTMNGEGIQVDFAAAPDNGEKHDLENILVALKSSAANIKENIMINLAKGTYTPTTGNSFGVAVNNVHIKGVGNDTIIDGKTFDFDGYGAFVIGADNCTVEDVKITSETTNSGVAVLKATYINASPAGQPINRIKNVTLKNVYLYGNSKNSGHGLNLQGVDGAEIDGVTIENVGKCGVSMAMVTGATFRNLTTLDSDSWGDIGFMFKSKEEEGDGASGYAYATYSDVTIDFETCSFAKGAIYSERPVGNDHDGETDIVRNIDGEIVSDETGKTVTTKDGKTMSTVVAGNNWGMAVQE